MIAVATLTAIICAVSAGAETYGDYTYTVLTDGTVQIDKYTGTVSEVEIPATIDGKQVTVIGYRAFYDRMDIVSVVVPEGVTKIDEKAFHYCSNMQTVSLPDSLLIIGKDAFLSCDSLSTFNIPKNVQTIDSLCGVDNVTEFTVASENRYFTAVDGVLFTKDMKKLIRYTSGSTDVSYTVPDSVTCFAKYAFYFAENLESISFGSNIESFSDYLFYACDELKSIEIPEGTVSIGQYTFISCHSLASVTLPSTLTDINLNVFKFCESLKEFKVSPQSTAFTCADGVLFNKEMTELVSYPTAKQGESYKVPDTVTHIGYSAFSKNEYIRYITSSNILQSFGSNAFSGCTNLVNVTFPQSLTEMGSGLFSDCTSITEITIPKAIKVLDSSTFSGCTSLATVTFEGAPEKIGDYCFQKCNSLVSLTLPEGVKCLDYGAFYECENLTSVVIPKSLTSMGKKAFYKTPIITDNKDALKYLGHWLIGADTNIVNADIKEGTLYISESLFESNTTIETATLPDSLLYVPEGLFKYCSALKTVKLGNNITRIDDFAFYCCDKLEAIEIPDSVITVGSGICYQCPSLKTVTFGDKVSSIGGNAFRECTSLKELIIPGNVKTIGERTFWGCSGVEKLVLCQGVTEIGYGAFGKCSKLTSCVIPYGVAALDSIFASCENLDYVVVPDSVTYMSDALFSSVPSVVVKCNTGSTAEELVTNDLFGKPYETAPIDEYAPVSFIATTTGSSVTLSWICTEQGLTAEIQMKNGDTWTTVATVSADTEGYTINGLNPDTEYSFRIKVKKGTAESVYFEKSVTTDKAPLISTVLTAKGGDKQIKLSWTAVSGADYYQVIRYNKGTYSVIATVKDTAVTVKGLTNGYNYTYLVKAVANDGRTSLSKAVTASPEYPITVTATAGDGQATLKWTAVSGAKYYQIIRYNKGVYSVVANINGTSATVMGLANDYQYTYLVSAVTQTGKALSAAVNVTPKSSLVLSVTAGDKQAALKWNAVNGAKYYQIMRIKNGEKIVVASVNTTTANVLKLVNGFEYTYYVQAIFSDGTMKLSNTVKVTPVAQLEKAVLTATAGNKQAVLSWTKVANADYYQIIRYNKGTYTVVATLSSTSVTVKGLTNGYQYTYLIKAISDEGAVSLSTAVNVTPKQ